MGNINDYVAALSPGEREKHKDLIAECLGRQGEIRRNTAESYVILDQLTNDMVRVAANLRQQSATLSRGFQELEASLQQAEASLQQAREKLSYAALVLTPDRDFYRA